MATGPNLTSSTLRIIDNGNGGIDHRIAPADMEFDAALAQHGLGPLTRSDVTTLQVNVGKLCNQACSHCHVDAGPKRTEIMPHEVAKRVVDVLAASPNIRTVDITGGAPELN